MFRSTFRVAASLARPAVIRRVAVAAISTAAVATTGTTTTGAGSVAKTNTRSRDVAHVSSDKAQHWSADLNGISAEQKALAKVQSSDPLERLAAATTRQLLQSACEAPGVLQAVLADEQVAQPAAVQVADEKAFLSKMEAEFGSDVLQVLRRQQWSVNVAGTKSAKDQVATVVCYFQEGTQRILYRRVSLA